MIKVAYVITELGYGGAQTMLLELIRGLDRTKFEVAVFVREGRQGTSIEEEMESLGIRVTYFDVREYDFRGSKLLHKLRSLKKIITALRKYDPDVVHAHLENSYSLIYAFLHRKPYAFTIHSYPDRIMTRQFVFLLERLRKRGRLALVGCAECVGKRTVELLGDPFSPCVQVIYNPIDREKYCKGESAHGKSVFVNVARMDPIKNQALLLRAFSEVVKEFRDAELKIVGDGECREELANEVKRLQLEEFVTFMGQQRDVKEILSGADVFVLSSNSECCPMTVLEAMASGLVVISTDVGGVNELVGDTGILVPSGEERELSNAMKRVLFDRKIRVELGKRARERTDRFRSELIVTEYENLYERITEKDI